ncbi:MAG: hypothetical protein KAR42_15590 [candidate division Zixibacteria bacterium]|nr:hypothetical protein [candidate division Zixibacteria bacterium]
MADQQTTETLRSILFETIEKVQNRSIDYQEAKAIGDLADRIIKTADLELKHAATVSKLDKEGQGITPGKLLLTQKVDD